MGVPDNAVGLAQKFGFLIMGNPTENIIYISNSAAQVRFGDDDLILSKRDLPAGWRYPFSHETSLMILEKDSMQRNATQKIFRRSQKHLTKNAGI
jgi:hypothetical protein